MTSENGRPVATSVPPATANEAGQGRQEATILVPAAPREIRPRQLSAEALAARYKAQVKLLGTDALFEDERGIAVAADPLPLAGPLLGELNRDSKDQGEQRAAANETTPDTTEIRANGNALGSYVPLLLPEHTDAPHPLGHFHGRLRALSTSAKPTSKNKVRIIAYGASHTQADIYTDYLRTYLQNRFGDGGHGHTTLVRTNRWYRYTDYNIENSRHWKVDRAQRSDALPDGHFGLSGASARSSRRHAYARVVPRSDAGPPRHGEYYEIGYLTQAKGGRFRIYVDGVVHTTVDTRRSGKAQAGFHSFKLPPGPHTIEVRPVGNGEVRLFGMTIESGTSGVVVDTLGISGTRAANHLIWNEASWTASLQRRQPDLYMLAYGTNESTDGDQPIQLYENGLRAVLDRFQRAAPAASCLLVGPGDWAQKIDLETWVQPPRLQQIIDVQRRVAAEFNCAYWDALQFMGGANSISTWANSHPQMASRDHIHLTRRGYVRMGMALTDAIMEDFDRVQTGHGSRKK